LENSRPQDLALLVLDKLSYGKGNLMLPDIKILNDLFDCLYYTSMCKEESDLIRVTITFIDPANPDPHPPKLHVPERWSCIAFESNMPLNIKTLAKLSKAADPTSTSLAVYFNEHAELYIWGLIDQAMHYQNFLNYESDHYSEQPGYFQVAISDIGTLKVLFDYELLATLKQNVLVKRYPDVLTIGPVSKMLRRNADFLKSNVRQYLEDNYPMEAYTDWADFLDSLWIQTLSRILLKIQDYQHGGALLITNETADLDIKYPIQYERLALSVLSYAKASIDAYVAENDIVQEFVAGKKSVSSKLYLQESRAIANKKATADEITGAVSFIASQTCVDGVVLFDSTMKANGFGTVLRAKRMPAKIYVSLTATATSKSLLPHDPTHYGTRHRSMISYCWKHSGSLGLVVSQDGDIRAFCRIENKLIMWESIKTQQYITNKAYKQKSLSTL